MSAPTPGRLDAWEQRVEPAIALLPYVMLVFSVILTVIIKHGSGTSLLIDVGLAAVLAAWMLFMFTLHPGWRDRRGLMAVFFAGFLVLAATLVIRDPWYGFFTFTGYFFVFCLPAVTWRLLGVLSVAALTGTSQAGGLPFQTHSSLAFYLAIVAVNMVVASGFLWFSWVSAEQNDRRKQAVAELSEMNRKLEATLAENAGLHQQLLAQAREAGVVDERQRMAREIHDTLAQGLTGIITQLQAAESAGSAADRARRVEAAIGLARESLSEARRSVHELRPEPLETARLGEALADVTAQWSALHGVPARLTTTGTVRPMPPETEVALLRTAQEALANVARHASASQVVLTLSYMEDEVALDVRDDGIGFDPAGPGRSADGGGFGLTAMRQRVENLSGTLEIESGAGAGTAVSACVPALPAQATA